MKDKIQEVNDYFKGKLLSGDYYYDVLFADFNTVVSVVVDGKYKFDFWLAEELENFSINGMFSKSFMEITLDKDEQVILYNNLAEPLKKVIAKKERQEKLKTYERLKAEFESRC